ncbi:MAG TPA: VWA domain-containing protein [Bryobacteraceae bacterium]|nr:VWA domain-containing protein [Bryobacteraceae bacterium]
MRFRRSMLWAGVLSLAASAWSAQAPAPSPAGPVIRTESRLVLVDAVVTDKKGKYIRNLEAKDFRVWEDKKEQTIKSFSAEADGAATPASRPRYLVLFFDNSTMDPVTRQQARRAASHFVDTTAGPSRLMAVVQFGGTLRIAQNFTADGARLKQVVEGGATGPNVAGPEVASLGGPRLSAAAADFGARSVLLALRSLARNLSNVPGRKTLVLFTSGFALSAENTAELTAAIDACNRANVAVYPIDARGLTAGFGPSSSLIDAPAASPRAFASSGFVRPASFFRLASFTAPGLAFQRSGPPGGATSGGGQGSRGGIGGGGGGMGSGGGTRGPGPGAGSGSGGARPGGGTTTGPGKGGTTGGSGGNTGSKPGSGGNTGGPGRTGGSMTGNRGGYYSGGNINREPRLIIPEFTRGTTAQQVLYALAEGTGGFVIVNSNDLAGGLERIGREQNEFYILGYAPPEDAEGNCHTLRVKVDRGGTIVRARSGYCNVKPIDILAGKPLEKELESRASDPAASGTPAGREASMRAPFFYSSPGVARVNVAIEIPAETVKFEKIKGKFQASVNVLGIAYREGGAIAARFSDTVKLELEKKKDLEEFAKQPLHYENQFEVAAGQYNLVVVFHSGGDAYGKLARPLVIEPYDGKQFVLSDVALSKTIQAVADAGVGLDDALLEGRTPLVAGNTQFTPAGTHRFKKEDTSVVYFEIYDPLLAEANPPQVGVQLRVLDRKTGEARQDSGVISVARFIQAGNPVVPVGLKLQAGKLPAGAYRLDLMAYDTAGRTTSRRSAEFELE